MPRQARLDVPGALHHIMVRGNNKASVFKDDQDKARFLERFGKAVSEGKCIVYAWVFMDNHVHHSLRAGKKAFPRSCGDFLRGMPNSSIDAINEQDISSTPL